MKKFTFRKWKREGPYRSFQPRGTDIKLGGKKVGTITCNPLDYLWTVSFAVKKEKTKKDPCPFKWVRLNNRYNFEAEAREVIKKKYKEIQEKFDLYKFE